MTTQLEREGRARRAVKGILLAAAAPLTVRDLEAIVFGFGHRDLDTFDVRDAVAWLVGQGCVYSITRNEFVRRPEALS